MRGSDRLQRSTAVILSLIFMFVFVQSAGSYFIGILSQYHEPEADMPVEEEIVKQMVLQLNPVEFYTLQIGSFETAEEGQACINQLAKMGYRVTVSAGPPYQVWLGCMGCKPALESFPEELRHIAADCFVQKRILNEMSWKFAASDNRQIEQIAALMSSYDVVLQHSLKMFQDFRYDACSEDNWADMVLQLTEELSLLEDSAGQILYENTDAFQKEGIVELMDKTVSYRESLGRMQKTKTDRSVLMAQSCLMELIEMYHQFMTTKEQP